MHFSIKQVLIFNNGKVVLFAVHVCLLKLLMASCDSLIQIV